MDNEPKQVCDQLVDQNIASCCSQPCVAKTNIAYMREAPHETEIQIFIVVKTDR